MKNKSLIISILLLFVGFSANAQSHNEQVTVESSYRPQIKRSERLLKTPEMPKNEFDIPAYKVDAKDFSYNYKMDVETMSAVGYKADYGVEGKDNFLKAAIGTRLSPVFLFRHYSDLSRKMSLGVGVKHYSSWLEMNDYKKSSFMNNAFNVMAVNKFKSGQMRSFVDYNFDMYHLRAYNKIENPNGRNIHSLNLGAKWLANGSSYRNLYNEIGGDYRATWVMGGTVEHQFNAKAYLAYSDNWISDKNIDDLQSFAADIELNYNNINQGQLLFVVNPYFMLSGDFYHVHVGARFDFKTGGHIGVYPDVLGSVFVLDDRLEFYARLGGRSKINTFADIVAENPFVTTSFENFSEFGYETTKIDFQGGVKAKIANNIDAHIGARYRKIKNGVFYVPDLDFYASYDEDATVYHLEVFDLIFNDYNETNILADVRWRAMEKLNVAAELSINDYNRTLWYKPSFTLALRGDYQLDETWKFNAAMKVLGRRWAITTGGDELRYGPAYDIQLGADYQIKKDFAAFAEIHNLIHDKYKLYYDYPSLGFELFVGIKYRF